jgi:hypothetical protein
VGIPPHGVAGTLQGLGQCPRLGDIISIIA